MFKFLLSVVLGVAKIVLMTTVILVGLFVIKSMIDHFLRYSVFSCVDKNINFTDSEAISRIKKHIEAELLGDYSYRNAYISSDYNKIARNAGIDRELRDYGWGISRKDASYLFQVDVINVEFIGSNYSYVDCYMLVCGRILSCEAH